MDASIQTQSPRRPRFKTTQDWHDFVKNNREKLTGDFLQKLRVDCYKEIEVIRGRPLLVYASRFLDVPPRTPNTIDLSDIDGFTDLVSAFKDTESIDVLLHSPGGQPDATERIVNILRNNFSEVHFIIPHSAYSAATMLALSGNSISLHPSATLGPIDPQINGIPARSIKRGFEKVREIIKNEGPEALPAYIPLLEKYSLDLLEICEDSEKLSKELVTTWLCEYMFNGTKTEDDVEQTVNYFSDYDTHLLHSRPLVFKKIKAFGLNISLADGDFQDLIWEAYLLLNGFFTMSHFFKLYENTRGVTWGKQFQVVSQPPQNQPPP
ncbi:MAG: hypothetical protein D6730_10235 [Bacteroidetes bacterium]|nr:MAG: hypothetical protein D6730_10235 [Bacteroidota bacterium]